MGSIIGKHQLASQQNLYRLIIYTNGSGDEIDAVSINKRMAEKLRKYRPTQRTIQIEKAFSDIIATLPIGATIKDFDVMFNPAYKIDVLRILIEANKRHPFSLIWSGKCEDNRLIYSEEELADYKNYEIRDYDILCVV